MERIEGLSIGLDLDSVGLERGLRGLKDKLKTVNSEMKANLSVFDRADRSVNSYQTKLNGLNKRLEVQKRIVKESKAEYEKLVKQHGLGSKEADKAAKSFNHEVSALNSLQRNIGRTADELTTLRKQQRLSESGWGRVSKRMTDFSGRMDKAGQSMQNVGQGMTSSFGVATAAVGGGLAIATKKAMDFESQVSSMQSVMSPEEVSKFGGKLKDLAITMGADTKYSATEAAQGIEELVKAGVSAKDIMGGGLKGALNLATAGELELKDAAEIASTALNAFKKDGITVSRAADLLAGAANASATDVGELKFGLSAVSAVASGVGLSFEDTTTALASFAQNGLKGSDAGTSLKTMLLNLIPSTEDARTEMSKLGLTSMDTKSALKFLAEEGIQVQGKSWKDASKGLYEYLEKTQGVKPATDESAKAFNKLVKEQGFVSSAFYDSSGKIKSMSEISGILKDKLSGLTDAQRQMALKTMFGTDAIRAANILYKEGTEGITDMNTAMNKIKASDVAKKKLDNLKGTIEQLKGSLETGAISIGSALLPALKTLTKYVQKGVDWFNELSPSMQKTIAVGGALTTVALGLGTAVGAILMVAGGAASGISVLTKGLAGGMRWMGKYRAETAITSASVATLGNTAAVSGAKMNTASAGMGRAGKGMKGLRGGAVAAGGALAMFGGKWGALIGIATTFLPEILKGGKALLGFGGKALGVVKNIGGLTRILGVARLGFGALGGPIGLLASIAIPSLITGGIKLYKHLKEKQIPALDSFGKKVSDSTTKAVLGYKKLNDDATTELNELYWSGKTISQKNADEISGIFGKMGDKISGKLKTDYDKSYGFLQDYFSKSKALTGQEEEAILGKTTARYERQRKLVKDSESKIKSIMDTAAKEKRALTEDEKIKINSIQANMQRTAVRTMSKSAAEQKIILGRLKNDSNRITAIQAAETVRNSLKAKDGAVKAAKDKYSKVKRQIEYERDVTGTISAKQADKLIKEARRQRDDSISAAKTMHEKVVKEAKAQAGGHAKQVDWETGRVKDGFDKMRDKINSFFNWVYDKLGLSHPKKKSTPKPKSIHLNRAGMYAKGTPSTGHPGGPAIVGEKGPELAHIPRVGTTLVGASGPELIGNLPKGSSVLPNHHTEQLLKSYGFPGYEKGIGNFFDWMTKGPKALIGNAFSKFNITDSLMPKWLTKIGSPVNIIKDLATKWIKKKMDNFGGFFGGGAAPNIKGGASAWRSMILKAASAMGEAITPAQVQGIIAQIQRESGGNQSIIQSSAVRDINTLNGNPARGLLQYIPQTFRAYAVKGHNNIYSGYDQLLAFFNNKSWRNDLPYGRRGWGPRGGRKFETGGLIKKNGLYNLADGGYPEFIIPTDPKRRTDAMKLLALAGKEIQGNKRPNQLPNVNTGQNNSVLEQLLAATLQQNQLLMQMLKKETNVYMDGDKVSKHVNGHNALNAALNYF